MFASAALAQAPKLAVEEMMVPSSDAGIEIYVRNKRPADMTSFRPERTVLYVHGATYPASTAFDLQLDGMSWMDYIASRGYDVYLLDLRGYGKSTRPEGNERQAGSKCAAGARRDGGEGHFIRRRFHSEAAQHPEGQSARLVVGHDADGDVHDAKRRRRSSAWCCMRRRGFATHLRWCSPAPDRSRPIGWCGRDQALGRWLTGVADDKKASLIPAGWFDAWADATWATDPEGGKMDPPVLRAPNGVVIDGAEFFGAGKAYYDPAKITVPTLLVLAEWDKDTPPYMAQTLFPLLTNSPGKRFVALAEGTHSIIMEKNRLQLFKAVQAFLDEAAGP